MPPNTRDENSFRLILPHPLIHSQSNPFSSNDNDSVDSLDAALSSCPNSDDVETARDHDSLREHGFDKTSLRIKDILKNAVSKSTRTYTCVFNKKQGLLALASLFIFSAGVFFLSSFNTTSVDVTGCFNSVFEVKRSTSVGPMETQNVTESIFLNETEDIFSNVTEKRVTLTPGAPAGDVEVETGSVGTTTLEQYIHDAAYVPGVKFPFVDLAAVGRCDVMQTEGGSEETDTNSTQVHVHSDNGIVTVYLTARDIQGNNRTYGGDVFRCELVQISGFSEAEGGIGREFRAYAFSYDHCNGTYACTLDMRHAAAGTYHVVLVHLSRMFMHEVQLLDPPDCGATVGSRYFNATSMLDVGQLITNETFFPNATVTITPQPLSTSHLPPCTMASPSTGRWVAQTVCFSNRTTDPTRNSSTERCRLGDSGMRVTDASVWVPFGCRLRYIGPEDFAQKAVAAGQRRVVVLGDSRSYNLWLALVQYLNGARTDNTTGLVNEKDLATDLPTGKSDNFYGRSVTPYYESYTGHNITVSLFQSYGSADHFDRFPCPEIPGIVKPTYEGYRKVMGTWFDKSDVLRAAPASEQPDVIIMQDGGIHDTFLSFSETKYIRNVRRIIKDLKTNFQGKRIIYVTLPAANVRDFKVGFSFRSEYHQWRRAQIGRKMFSEAGYEVWDIHQMTATRADRYFDAMHFFPQPYYACKWNEMPMLLVHELVQDLVNRMYR